MKLQDIFDHLSHGELRNVFLTDPSRGELTEENKKQLLTHVRMGLTALHNRFFIKEQVHSLVLEPGETRYVLDLPDLLRIESVKDTEDNEYLLNILNEPESLHTPNYRTLVVPASLDATMLLVTYRADHKPFGTEETYYPPNMVDIDLPPMYLEPLLYFVASRVMNPIGMTEAFHDGNNYAAKYEQACQRLVNDGYPLDQGYHQDRFHSNGGV